MKNISWFTKLCVFVCLSISVLSASAENKDLKLRYDRPADFFEEALVIGNGRLGAIVYGGTKQDRISLNDITLWTGEPDKKVYSPEAFKVIPEIRTFLDKEDYRNADRLQKQVQGHYSENYQPLGTLTITYPDGETKAYERWLDISQATAEVRYEKNGADFKAQYIASAPDSVIAIRLTSNSESGIIAQLAFDSQLPHAVQCSEGEISATGYAAYHSFPSYHKKEAYYDPERGIHFRTLIRVVAPEGTVKSFASGEIKIDGAKEALILVTNATSFNGFDKDPVKEGRDYVKIAKHRMDQAARKSFQELYEAHVADYKYYFDRVELDLGKTNQEVASLTTDKQLKLYTDEQQTNPELEALYFQYGRYLLISSSRTSGIPANLQGLWNEQIFPPWSSNYTVNINLEENYWAAEIANLSEMHQSLFDFIKHISQGGEQTAKAYYGVDKGWCLGHNSDIWAMTCPVGLRSGDPVWACWNMGGAWLSTHIWEHYLFTKDDDFLVEYYPILRGAAEFCLGWLIEKDGYLMTSPGTSPENKYLTSDGYAGATLYGNASDMAMIRECLLNTKSALNELKTDKDLGKRIDQALARLLPYKIGERGNLQEWFHDWRDEDPHHRHQSHLYGLYPGHHITVESTPQLAKACAKVLEIKGDETTGWSTGWRVNLYARLGDADNAYHIYRKLLRYVSPDGYRGHDARRGGGTYPNLLDAHSPFQIDGNFGGCAGVIEMLMQSTLHSITLLPALPKQWKEGSVKGICARGGFVIDMTWKEGRVTGLTITGRKSGRTTVKYNGLSKRISLKEGESKVLI